MLGCIQPMSSPMMKRMLGFCCCCAAAGVVATITAMSEPSRPSHICLAILLLLFVNKYRLPVTGRQPAPYALRREPSTSRRKALLYSVQSTAQIASRRALPRFVLTRPTMCHFFLCIDESAWESTLAEGLRRSAREDSACVAPQPNQIRL